MYIVVISLLIVTPTVLSKDVYELNEHEKRRVSSFDTLAGMGLGKRAQLSSIDSLAGLGIGLREGDLLYQNVKKSLSNFDTLGGIGLGKRGYLFPRKFFVPYRTLMESKYRNEGN
ncbi:hypothetical protein DICVIV_08804 [Dictyocaulus viviparus]|uniref:Uncharacterized protein n=1 Tax=Dictyocaulus viviparus TaxID=29172 RepID=A0A0D8XN33_DICVI|nr:hypothetical protein DICVIV_08804 [Dictyocaulus viviparus]